MAGKLTDESQQNPAFIPREQVEHIFDEIAEFIVSATKKNCPETHESIIGSGDYRLTLGDMRGLSYYFRDLTDELSRPSIFWRTDYETNKVWLYGEESRRSTSSTFRVPKSMQPTDSTTVPPVTTMSTAPNDSPAMFPGFPRKRRRRVPGPNTAAFVSADNVTEITWFGPISGYPSSEEYSDPEVNPPPSPETEAIPSIVITRPSSEDQRTQVSSKDQVPTEDGRQRRRQGSKKVCTGRHEVGEVSQSQTQHDQEQPKTVVGKLRKKSIELGQAVGSFVNGAYRNLDYQPRRESSAVRMRAILERLSPPLPTPEQNTAIFSAMTGARPVEHEDFAKAMGPSK